jgi:predicted metal-dependent hydrolase
VPVIEYSTKVSSRARNVRVTVHRDGSVVLTVPRRGSERAARAFLESRMAWVEATRERMRALPPPTVPAGGKREYGARREEARALALRLVEKWNAIYGFRWNSVRIGNQKSRWGSCSRRGTLSFNYRIVHLPPRLADYLAVHELCHLGEMNHSARFWALVERALPNYRELRAELSGGRRVG